MGTSRNCHGDAARTNENRLAFGVWRESERLRRGELRLNATSDYPAVVISTFA